MIVMMMGWLVLGTTYSFRRLEKDVKTYLESERDNIDVETFLSLPKEIQTELVMSWKAQQIAATTKKRSISTSSSSFHTLSSKKTKSKAKGAIDTFFQPKKHDTSS